MPLHRKRPEDKSLRWQPQKSVRVHLDDINEIITVLQNAAGCVTAETDDFVGTISAASEIEEAARHGQSSIILHAGQSDRMIRVGLCRPVGTLIVPGDDLGLVGAAEKVHELLRLCQTRFGGVGRSTAAAYAVVASAMLVATALLAAARGFNVAGMLVAWSLLAMLLLRSSMAGPNRSPEVALVLTHRRDAPTWWARNRTTVIVGLFTNAVVGALFFLVGQWSS